ncbi:MAG: DUF2442 domain-containing protein [Gallionella sp.]|nr:DUF2442 domain-containing protein [Gallionella sp.]MDD4959856.1 DUF2442 domain-containing protein [Gallionella sp.]
MYWDVISVRPAAPRTLEVVFADGLTGTVLIDISFCTGVFDVLQDDQLVHLAYIENGVIFWQGGLDLAPDTMYREIKKSAAHHYVVRAKHECLATLT